MPQMGTTWSNWRKKGEGRRYVPYQPAAEGLHGDHAHVVRLAQLHEAQLLWRRQGRKRELDGVEQAGLDGRDGNSQAVVGDAQEAGLATLARLQQARVGGVGVVRVGQPRRVVRLQDIHVVGAEVFQAFIELGQDGGPVPATQLGGQDDLAPNAGQRLAEFGLAVGVDPGRIERPPTAMDWLPSRA